MHLSWLVLNLVLKIVIGDDDEYQFRYRVKDQETGQDFGQEEERLGDDTGGEYQVLLPDGRTQIVRYRASDPSGFVANVEYQGEVTIQDSPVQSHRIAKKLRPAVETINLAGRGPIPSPVVKNIPAPRPVLGFPTVRVVQSVPSPRLVPGVPKLSVIPPVSKVISVAPRFPSIRASNRPTSKMATKQPLRVRSHVARKEKPRVVAIQSPKIKTLKSVIIPRVIKKTPVPAPHIPVNTPKLTKLNVKIVPMSKVRPRVVPRIVLPKSTTTRKPTNTRKLVSTARLTKKPSEPRNKAGKKSPRKDITRSSKSRKTLDTKLPAPVMPKKLKNKKLSKHISTRSTTEKSLEKPTTTQKPVEKPNKTTESPEYTPSSEPPKMEYKASDHVASSSKVLNSLFREDIKGMMNKEGEEET